MENFCLQETAFYRRICSSVKPAILCTHRHITVFMFLHIHTTFNQDLFSTKCCLMRFVKPSHASKLKSVLYSYCLTVYRLPMTVNEEARQFVWTKLYIKHTEKLSHSLRFVRKGIATKHVDQNKDLLLTAG